MNTSMNFSLFTASVVKGLQEKMGKEYKVFSNSVKKNNGIELTGIIAEEKNCNTSPTIYIDDFYQNYKNGMSLEEITESLYSMFCKHRITEPVDLSNFTAYETAGKQIAFKVVNYEKNWELLKNVPHKVFCNLAIIFYYAVQEPPFYGKASILINKTHLKNWKISEEELYQSAMTNTPVMFPARIENIEDVVLGMLNNGMKQGFREQRQEKEFSLEISGEKSIDDLLMKMKEDLTDDSVRIPMYVLSNKQRLQGAACMFYPNVLKNFAREKGCDIYILPSSIHEVILLPASEAESAKALLEMVTEINGTHVEECEVLADSIYYYRKEEDKIERLC